MDELCAPEFSQDYHAQLREQIDSWNHELYEVLPGLPDDIEVTFDNRYLISVSGTGGFALSRNKIALAFDPEFQDDKDRQLVDFKGAYFHECFHLIQGWTGEDTASKQFSAIDNAIYEGTATVFERDRTDANPLWASYGSDETMLKWVDEIKQLPIEYDWRKYKFYDPETDRRWIMYRVGTFIADRALQHNPELKIEDLATKTPGDILALAGL